MRRPAALDHRRDTRRSCLRRSAGGIMLAAIVVGGVSVTAAGEPSGPSSGHVAANAAAAEELPDSRRDRLDIEPAEITEVIAGGQHKLTRFGDGNERQIFLIQLRDAAVPSYTGGLPGLSRTAPRGARQLNVDGAPVRAYREHLVEEQVGFERRMEDVVDRPVHVPFRYQYAVNGIAAMLTPDEARAVAADPAVVSIVPDEERKLLTDAGPQWSGAEPLWNAEAELGLPSDVKGEGIVIGTIDTGISPGNRSFADVGDDGYDHVNPRGPGNYLGVCNPDNPASAGGFDPAFPCNDKLIGAYVFGNVNGNAVDSDGHGSHTASTSGGNVLRDVAVGASPVTSDISGVAPHANVISYLGCCKVSALTAAIDQAIADEVDVINYSIGELDPSRPWEDYDTVGFLNARAAGIFVAVANGNDGPSAGSTFQPADAPWLTSAGASTHDRRLGSALTGLGSSEGALPDIAGTSITGPLATPTPIVHASIVGDPLCQDSAGHEDAFAGRIVVCDRGDDGVTKSINVAAQGADGFVLIHGGEDSDLAWIADEYAVPGVLISSEDGAALEAWLEAGSDHEATIAGTTVTRRAEYGDVMAVFSSRGPNGAMDTIVPSVTAPGVRILAALATGSSTADVHGVASGTSMASPHVAGAGALLAQARPNWTPAQVQSALMTSARSTVLSHDGQPATPYTQGSGHIDVGAAARAGLLFDETFADYAAADPALGGDPTTLNLPSFADSVCAGSCSWQRTATVPDNAAGKVPSAVTWTATATSDDGLALDVVLSDPTVSPGDTLSIEVTADVSGGPFDETLFGRITLTPDNPAVPKVTMPVAVVPLSGVLPDALDVTTRRDAGSHLVPGIRSIPVSQFSGVVHGMTPATLVEGSLAPDPTWEIDDDFAQLDVHLIEVPAGATRLVVETIETEMGDLNLLVGTGATPSVDTSECFSGAPTSVEQCDLSDPAAGTWWVAVQNRTASTPGHVDDYVIATGVVPGHDSGNAGVAGPTGAVPGGEPYDVRFHWDLPTMQSGAIWYGTIELGTSPATPDDIGSIPVTLRRAEDDVVKTASVSEADIGDDISYEITVQPNTTTEDRAYTIVDTVPDGLTIVPASVTGGGVVDGQTITWEIETPAPFGAAGTYVASTPETDPQCAEWAGFVDLGARPFSIPFAPLDGDTIAAIAFESTGPFELYGQQFPNLTVTEDGLVTVAGGYGGVPFFPQAIPDGEAPNGVFAALWSDLELSLAENRGMRLGRVPALGAAVIQWENPFKFTFDTPGPSVGTFQAWIYATAEDYRPEVTFEYATLGALPAEATIGIENLLGDRATAVLGMGDPTSVLEAGGSICLDYQGPSFRPTTLAYDVTVDTDARSGTYTNRAVHGTDDPFGQPSIAFADVAIAGVDPTSPSAPQSPGATPGRRSVRLTWQPPSSQGTTAVTDYVIQRATSRTGPWRTVRDGVSTARTATARGLTNGRPYFFRVAARNEVGRGPFSAIIKATPRTVPRRPRALRATPHSRAIRLAWARPASNGGAAITDYVVQRATSRTGPWRTVRDGVSTRRAVTIIRLDNGRRYFLRVAARNGAGHGAFSAIVAATPRRT